MSRPTLHAQTTHLARGRGHQGKLVDETGRVWSWRAVLDALATDGSVATVLERAITQVPFPGVFWECGPVVGRDLDQPFQWVVVDSPAVARLIPSPGAFRAPMADAPAGPIAVFPNLGHDAVLVAPRPGGDGEQAAHLVDFLRTARSSRRRALWTAIGSACQERLSARPDAPLWLSTSGLGVPWLHVRLDDRPKYITWRPFRAWSPDAQG